MNKKDSSLLSRRNWLKTTGTLGLGAVASAVATPPRQWVRKAMV